MITPKSMIYKCISLPPFPPHDSHSVYIIGVYNLETLSSTYLKLNSSSSPQTPISPNFSISVYDFTILSVPKAQNFKVIFDSSFSLSSHHKSIAMFCWFLLYISCIVSPFLYILITTILVQALILSHLDCRDNLLIKLFF